MRILAAIVTGIVGMMVVCFIGTLALVAQAIKAMEEEMKELDDLESGKNDRKN